LALCKENEPYVVPMHYAWQSGYLIFILLEMGKRSNSPNKPTCFILRGSRVENNRRIRSCNWTTHYRSVIGSGIVEFVEDEAEKQRPLKPSWDTTLPGHLNFQSRVGSLLVWKIKVDELTGKKTLE